MEKLTIKKACKNKCGRKVIIVREKHGTTPAIECATCRVCKA